MEPHTLEVTPLTTIRAFYPQSIAGVYAALILLHVTLFAHFKVIFYLKENAYWTRYTKCIFFIQYMHLLCIS